MVADGRRVGKLARVGAEVSSPRNANAPTLENLVLSSSTPVLTHSNVGILGYWAGNRFFPFLLCSKTWFCLFFFLLSCTTLLSLAMFARHYR